MKKKVSKKKTATRKSAPKKSHVAAKPKRKRGYEGASKSKRMSGWKADSTSANTETAKSLPELRNRARDLRRNNPYASRGVQVITSNVVGTGIVTQFRSDSEDRATNLETLWGQWAEKTSIDFDGHHNIYGLQSLVMDTVIESGEALIRRRVLAGLRFPFQYQVLEPDFLDVTKTEAEVAGGGFIIQGIEFTAQGKRVAYWLYETHPGGYDAGALRGSMNSNRIPANELYHVYRMERAGQARGVPWLSPVIVRLKDFDDMEDAQLMRQKIAACFTAFVRDISHDFYPADDDADLYGEDEAGEVVDIADRMTPGLIEELPKGKMVEFADPPSVENYAEYASTVLHAIAAGLGITYEALTGDYSQVNYSSGRMGRLEMNRNVRAWQERIIQLQFLDKIVDDFKLMLEIEGTRTEGVTHVHVAPPIEMIDPTKEVPMQIEEIRGGLESLTDRLLSRGKDPKRFLEQYKKDLDLLDSLGIKLISDPRVELSNKGKNTIKGEIGDDENGDSENTGKARSNAGRVRSANVQRGTKHNGRRMDNRRAR